MAAHRMSRSRPATALATLAVQHGARFFGYEKLLDGTQRVSNWLSRGIPAAVKVERPDLFLVTSPAANPIDVH
ncbi:hypothetical protein AB4851_22360 [Burkholderia sp. 22PA0099]|uniref:hypothetical protein n=1 Tax=Burkholderia sp. 22PA0099 TaxID=3237372 RepID=UPI0039C22C4F